MNIEELKWMRESEDKVEFKAANKDFSFDGGTHSDIIKKRKCFLGYVVAFCNEGGGKLVLGMSDDWPHKVVGTEFHKNTIGDLIDKTYEKIEIRVAIEELFEEGKRVLCIVVPTRPVGKLMKFEGVALMRVGESLRNMSDDEMRKILWEQEPDFSSKICEGCEIDELDIEAIHKLKVAYSQKQKNPLFLTLPDNRCLSDLDLIVNNKITYAAIILLGKRETIKKYLPQSSINFEFRNNDGQINFDSRTIFCESYFTSIDKIWELINLRNGNFPVQQGAFIFDIPFFNKEVIRESLNNSVAHRDYSKASEILIKQYQNELHIINPGGFPLGVNLTNLINVNSTPRNRLLADVMAKTGVVERSGQGIDKIFFQTISEAKKEPDYSFSDNFQVELRLSGVVEDQAFAIFIQSIQSRRRLESKLSLAEVMTLNGVRKEENKDDLDSAIIRKLTKEGLIERVGKTTAQTLILSKEYYSFTGKEAEYSSKQPLQSFQAEMIIINHLEKFKTAKMGDFCKLLSFSMKRDQVRYIIGQLLEKEALERKGSGKQTYYVEGKKVKVGHEFAQRVIQLGMEQMQKLGELKFNS